jgi:hypothetical protein
MIKSFLIRNSHINIDPDPLSDKEQQYYSRIQFKSPDQYFDKKNISKELFETSKFKRLSKLETIYDKELKQIIFSTNEKVKFYWLHY